MPFFSYWIRTREGSVAQGHREATNADELRRWLEGEGLLVLSITESRATSSATTQPIRLTNLESEQILREVAAAQSAQVPLELALRAAAQAVGQKRLRQALEQTAAAVETGRPLDEALDDLSMPDAYRGLIRASYHSGHPAEVLMSVLEQEQSHREMWRSVWNALAYPLALLLSTLALFVFAMFTIVRSFQAIFENYGLVLPLATRAVLWWGDVGVWMLLGMAIVVVSGLAATRWTVGRARWRRILITVPVLGPLWQWSGAARFAGLLSALLRYEIPLPEALRLAAQSTQDADLRERFAMLAERVEAGESLSDSLRYWPLLPEGVMPYVRWGEQHRSLADSLRAAEELMTGRARIHAASLRVAAPPLIFMLVFVGAAAILVAIGFPLFALMHGFL